MNLTGHGKVFFLIFLFSLFFSYLIITLNYFPHLGISLSLIIFLLFTYKFKKDKNKDTKLYLVFALLSSILLFMRSEPLITFLNLVAALLFGLLMLITKEKREQGLTDYVYSSVFFFIQSLLIRSEYFLEFKEKKEGSYTVKATEVAFGIIMTIFLMVIVLPILSSTNPFFSKLVTDFWKYLNLENFLNNVGFENLFIWCLRLASFLFFIFIIPKIITLINKSYDYSLPSLLKTTSLPLLIPKMILAIILFVFFITQFQFYFASDETLKNMGLSYSQHTREVFAQLSFVAGIVLLLVYNARKKVGLDNLLNWVLGVQGIFLTLMAYKSVFEYINVWGLTYKRLYGLTFATWVTGIFLLFFDNYRQKIEAGKFVKNAIIFTGITLFMVNVLNFDYLIYNFRKAATGTGIDYTYLSTLSSDSLSYYDQLTKLKKVTDEGEYTLEKYNNENPLMLIYKIEYLKMKYSKFNLRILSLLEFWQYQKIKSVETEELRAFYENKIPFNLQKLQ